MKVQQMLNEMYNGNPEAIMQGVTSENDYLLMNAILSGAKQGLKNESFINSVKKAVDNESVVLGFPISSVANAAFHFLTGKKYGGTDNIVKSLLQSKFDI